MFVGGGEVCGGGECRVEIDGWVGKRAGEGDYSAGVPVKLTE